MNFQDYDENVLMKLSESIVESEDRIRAMEKQLTTERANVDEARMQLAVLMQQNGLDAVSLSNGLSPRVKVSRKVYKIKDVDNAIMHDWLRAQGLGDIIHDYVHWPTLNSTINDFIDKGSPVPDDVFTVSEVPSVTMYGKSRYLKSKGQ